MLNHDDHDDSLRDLRERLCGGASYATLGIIYKDGNGDSFPGVDFALVNYDRDTEELSFEIANRVYFVPGVRYYTRQD